MDVHPLAGKPAPRSILAPIPRLVTAYFVKRPDPSALSQRVAFGTSGHRGSSFKSSFNEPHILATVQAICDFRRSNGIAGPLFLGMDTHALLEPTHFTVIEVLAANVKEVGAFGYTPFEKNIPVILARNILPQPKEDRPVTTHDASMNGLINLFGEMSEIEE
jgi:phosphoglucomutase